MFVRIAFKISLAILLLASSCASPEQETASALPVEGAGTRLLSPEELLRYVPSPPAGYLILDTVFQLDTATGDPISNLGLVMENPAQEQIFLNLSDYFSAQEFFDLIAGLWQPELAFERDGSYARALDLPDRQGGWLSFDSAVQQGTMLVHAQERFVLSLRTEASPDMTDALGWATSGWLSKLP